MFIAGLFVLAADALADIHRWRGRAEEADQARAEARRMEAAVRAHGWDGSWFLRAYDDAGRKVGSRECDEGRIFIETQGICPMAGIGLADGRARAALDAVAEHLATPHGIVLHQPAYTRYRPELGEITSYPPGYKENAGVFCHNNPWIMIAEVRAGNADRALDYYLRINPSAREAISEVHRLEPYVYAQMIAGSDAPTHGEAKNSWLTGTAAWNYVAVTQWILGIRPSLDGLRDRTRCCPRGGRGSPSRGCSAASPTGSACSARARRRRGPGGRRPSRAGPRGAAAAARGPARSRSGCRGVRPRAAAPCVSPSPRRPKRPS